MLGISKMQSRTSMFGTLFLKLGQFSSSMQRSRVTLNTLSRLILIHWFIWDFGMIVNQMFLKGTMKYRWLLQWGYPYHIQSMFTIETLSKWNVVAYTRILDSWLKTTAFPKSDLISDSHILQFLCWYFLYLRRFSNLSSYILYVYGERTLHVSVIWTLTLCILCVSCTCIGDL